MIEHTSAKSRLMSPSLTIRSVMQEPATRRLQCNSTAPAARETHEVGRVCLAAGTGTPLTKMSCLVAPADCCPDPEPSLRDKAKVRQRTASKD